MNSYSPIFQEFAPKELYDLEKLSEQDGALKISLINDNGCRIRIRFKAFKAYRKLDEGDALISLGQISKSAKPRMSFYRVEPSDFIEWFVKQSYDIYDAKTLVHFAIITINDVIDVISREDPIVD
ncbi:hypothetical protein [Noviherbaspirillum sp.]|uniref:hypothetical protein n=1 Tax=Noviherbaspirillum sp. TaxID=1926288 RepID=UPI002FE3AF5F